LPHGWNNRASLNAMVGDVRRGKYRGGLTLYPQGQPLQFP
jgi:hypothetical protein